MDCFAIYEIKKQIALPYMTLPCMILLDITLPYTPLPYMTIAIHSMDTHTRYYIAAHEPQGRTCYFAKEVYKDFELGFGGERPEKRD